MSMVHHALYARTLRYVVPVLFALCMRAPGTLYAAQVTLAWDANLEPTVAGYKLYYGEVSGQYHGAVKVGKTTTYTFSGLEGGRTYYVAVTAYDDAGRESGFSAEVSYQVPDSTNEDVDRDVAADVDQTGEDSAGENPQVPQAPLTPTPVKVWIEAEDGILVVPMELASDEQASGGLYLWVPDGRGDVTDPLLPAGEARYGFEVPASGVYMIWGRVQADIDADSFLVVLDENYEEAVLWDTARSTNSEPWRWDGVNDRGVGDPALFLLEAGEHTLTIKQREDGAKIDKILITNDFDYTPTEPGQ